MGSVPATLLLTQHDVARLVDVVVAIRVVREASKAMARGQAAMPPKLYLPLPRESDLRAMPAALAHPAACGIKWVNVHPHNRPRGLPTVMALIVLNDPATGFPLAVMDGLLITKLRTAAASAVATHALAARASRIVALVGCGAQADAQLLALAAVRRVEQVRVWGYLPREASRFCRRMRKRLPESVFRPCKTVEEAVRGAHVVTTLTPSHQPLVKRAWLAPGTHLNAVGADAPGKQELEAQVLRDALVVVDERKQAIHGGELNVSVAHGQFDPARIHATLGEVLLGRKPGRRLPQQLTVFDSTGLAIHDIALAHEAFQRARHRGLGRRLRFFDPRVV